MEVKIRTSTMKLKVKECYTRLLPIPPPSRIRLFFYVPAENKLVVVVMHSLLCTYYWGDIKQNQKYKLHFINYFLMLFILFSSKQFFKHCRYLSVIMIYIVRYIYLTVYVFMHHVHNHIHCMYLLLGIIIYCFYNYDNNKQFYCTG